MSHPLKHVGSLVIVLLVTYFVIRNWTGIKSALAGASVPGATPGGSLLSFFGLNPGNASNGRPGDPAFSTAFGGSGGSFDGAGGGVRGGLSLFEGPLARAERNAAIGGDLGFGDQSYLTTPGGLGGGAIEEGNAQGGGNIGPVPNSFGNCSTNPRDGKLLCP